VRSYRDRIRELDAAIGRIRRLLADQDQWEDTLLLVTSDHGEAFFEHGLAKHGYVPYEEVLRVPLIVSHPRSLGDRQGSRVDVLAWHLDLAPTILGWVGEPPLGQGRDLGPWLRGQTGVEPETEVHPLVLPIPGRPGRLPPRRAVVGRSWKYVQGHPLFGDDAWLLFDLGSDEGEARNLRATNLEEGERLSAALASYRARLKRHAPIHRASGRPVEPGVSADEAPDLAPEDMQALRALGYVE
jgi:arylsulfatase A-like enzyme